MNPPHATQSAREGCFLTTHWSVVLAAKGMEPSSARPAMEELCRGYWRPLYSYIRRRGYPHEDAKDLTQEFLLRLITHDFLASVHSDKGRFRSFLLAALNHFLVNEWRRANTQRRGGDFLHLSLDAAFAKGGPIEEPASAATPEAAFDRRWALTILERAVTALRQEFAAADKLDHFEMLQPFLTGTSAEQNYEGAAERLKMKPDTVAVAVHRLRKRFRELVRWEVAQTVESEDELDGEMRYLLSVLSR